MKFRLIAALALLFSAPALSQNIKISDLPPASALTGAERIPGVQAGATVRITPSQIATYLGPTFQPLDSDLTSIAALSTTSTGRNLLTAADAAAIRTQAALGSIATQSAGSVSITGGSITGITDLAVADGGSGASTASGARANFGLVIGTDVQAYHANLAAFSGLTLVADRLPYANGSGTLSLATFTAAGRALIDDADAAAQRATLGVTATGGDTVYAFRANNLSDLANATTARSNLGLAIGTNVQAFDSDLTTWSGITPGTGVGTALAINVGSAGSVVTNGGALGTPSSATLTNATGLPISGLTASTLTAIGVGSVELGHASDTTLSRSSSGVLAVEGVTVSLNSTSATHTAGSIELGAASDTTLARASAGDITVEGNAVYRAGGTDVAVADGGTGSSTASGARTNLGLAIGTDVQAYNPAILGAWTSWTPAVTSGTGTITAYTSSGGYRLVGKTLYFWATVTITTAGTGAGNLIISNIPGTTGVRQVCYGGEDAVFGHMVWGTTTAAATTLTLRDYSGGTFIASGARVQASCVLEVN